MQLLLERVWQGEEEALTEVLYEHYDRLATRLKFQIPKELQRSVSEEDVLQDVFISVFKSFRSLNPCSEAAFQAWLDSVAKNQLADAIRKARTKKRGGDKRQIATVNRPSTGSVVQMVALLFGNEMTPSLNVARKEATEALLAAIDQLPPDQSKAVKLRFLQGHELEEVAQLMDRTEDSIRNLIYRAKDSLRHKMRISELWLDKK
jgi:RNA polymerase sigma-70 factor (ECF subfamily)